MLVSVRDKWGRTPCILQRETIGTMHEVLIEIESRVKCHWEKKEVSMKFTYWNPAWKLLYCISVLIACMETPSFKHDFLPPRKAKQFLCGFHW